MAGIPGKARYTGWHFTAIRLRRGMPRYTSIDGLKIRTSPLPTKISRLYYTYLMKKKAPERLTEQAEAITSKYQRVCRY
jgi:hypothetical protein